MIQRFMRLGGLQLIAFAILSAAIVSANKRAALPALTAILKFVWPLLLIWFVWRFVKARVTGKLQKFQEQILQATRQGAGTPSGPVLDLCPQCGTLLTQGHRCAKR